MNIIIIKYQHLKIYQFYLIILIIIIIRSFKFIIKNKSNKSNFDINYFKDILNKKKLILTFKTFKKKIIKKYNFIKIIKINAFTYYYLFRNKKNKLFFLIINEIYDIFNELFIIIL